MKSTKAVTVLVLVGTGSKYEKKEESGISHFLEHMFFKGTKKRPSTLKIAETLDRVGGVYNAFTGKEYTGYWAKVNSKHLNLALDWVSDILLNSKIGEKEIERERGVIIEEINMYLDNPQSYIGDLFEKLLYGNQPAGRLIIGKREIIRKFKRKDFLNYLNNHYSAKNTVICLAGKIDGEKTLKKAKEYFKKIRVLEPEEKPDVIEKQKKSQVLVHFKKTDQTHLILGVRSVDLFSPSRYSQAILTTILGGNMSSRLFLAIREKEGLAYYIKTGAQAFTDTGYLATFAGVDNKRVERAISLILKEYKNLKEKEVKESELQKAKDYLRGTLTLALESSDALVSFYGIRELLEHKILTIEQVFAKIDDVTTQDVQKLANEIFQPEKLNLALIGPFRKKEKFEKLLKI